MAPEPKKFTFNDYSITFGPNETIIASCPNQIFFHNVHVSTALDDLLNLANGVKAIAYSAVGILKQSHKPAKAGKKHSHHDEIPELVLTEKVPDPYVAYSRKGRITTHHEVYQPTGPDAAIPKLQTWLSTRLSSSSFQVVADAQGGWWASAGKGETAYESIPPALRQLFKPTSLLGRVTHVALGINGSYVAVFEDGDFQWDLMELYPDLDAYLKQRTTGEVVYVSLDPFRGDRFFAAFSDATILYRLPASAIGLENALIEAEDLRSILFSPTVQHSKVKLSQNSSDFTTFLSKVGQKVGIELAEGIVESIIED